MSSHQKITAMRLGGRKLGQIKAQLQQFTKVGMTFAEIESEAQQLIKAAGCTPSFSTVPGYHWATCIMQNDELCHGIPAKHKIVGNGDVITIDVGLLQDGYHLDTTVTFTVGEVPLQTQEFVNAGSKILKKAIEAARVGSSVYDVSKVMQHELEKRGYGAVYQLTGHGVGEELHMDPAIPCVADAADRRQRFHQGQTVAIEVMYTLKHPHLVVDADGWTFRTKDGSLGAMFEETVLITPQGPEVLTKSA